MMRPRGLSLAVRRPAAGLLLTVELAFQLAAQRVGDLARAGRPSESGDGALPTEFPAIIMSATPA